MQPFLTTLPTSKATISLSDTITPTAKKIWVSQYNLRNFQLKKFSNILMYLNTFLILRNWFDTDSRFDPPIWICLASICDPLLQFHIYGPGIHMHPRIQIYTIATTSLLSSTTESQEIPHKFYVSQTALLSGRVALKIYFLVLVLQQKEKEVDCVGCSRLAA